MARITDYVEVDVDIDVSPREFLNSCKAIEIQELVNHLIKDGYIDNQALYDADDQWHKALYQLKHLNLRMSREDQESILSIVSKYTSIKYY